MIAIMLHNGYASATSDTCAYCENKANKPKPELDEYWKPFIDATNERLK